jgi:hypothetical protein
MFLVDTSVWIRVFQKRDPLDLTSVVDLDEVVTCLPVVQEVLQGFREEGAFLVARQSMLAFPIVESPLGFPVFEDAVNLYRRARRAGFTVRSGVDCVIAACALRNHLTVLHHDRDYQHLTMVSSLRTREV